ncbi:MAG: biotin/lipoyl-binding protein, partial [Chloroflexi bacterium]|nr:biotin/lipoyl-binding protein [Chloroflexota bacterium]
PAAESYLSIPALLAAARQSGADAVHPGHGFLSERAEFAEACRAAGLIYVGPTPGAMRALGDKAAARALAAAHGVPLLPGYHGGDQTDERLAAEAEALGYPLVIKAAAGGGGRGMRVVRQAGEFAAALASARREAQAAFGNGQMLLERYAPHPRHIEIQVLGDHHGALVSLGERECSIQRRHQKVIEEAPAPGLDPVVRDEMTAAALRLARAAGYTNAGTVEFLLDVEGAWRFLEVNTRLQVEHPVTEEVTGLDLVALQLRIAAGEPLPPNLTGLRPRGHAIETRLYAEDPAAGYLPSSGRLRRFRPPQGAGIRNEIGVAEGDEIGVAYDPMLAKLIATGADRTEAAARLRTALDAYEVAGIPTNLDQLRTVAADPAFLAGGVDTGYLERLAAAEPAPVAEIAVIAAAWMLAEGGLLDANAPRTPAGPWQAGPWRAGRWNIPLSFTVAGTPVQVAASYQTSGQNWRLDVALAGAEPQECMAEISRGGDGAALLRRGPRLLEVRGVPDVDGVTLTWNGGRAVITRGAAAPDADVRSAAAANHTGELAAPLPGRVVALYVAEGDTVEAHQPLAVLEAMKMEHPIAAPYAGVVSRVLHAAGDQVARGDVLFEMRAA